MRAADFPFPHSEPKGGAGIESERRARWTLEDAEDVEVSETPRKARVEQPTEGAAAELLRKARAARQSPPEPEPAVLVRPSGELSYFVGWLAKISGSLAAYAFHSVRFVVASAASYARAYPVHCMANLAFAGTIALLLATGFKVNEELITLRTSDRTLDDLVAASQYTRSYSLGELEQRKEREFLRVGAPAWVQRESIRSALAAARSAGLSLEHQAVLLATAEIESGFNPMANAATTTACGVFQFIRATGEMFGLKASDCLSPTRSAEAAVAHYTRNYAALIESRVEDLEGPERMFRTFELSYYLHHDGPSSSHPSDELKATVLAGAPFLFKAYEILEREELTRSQHPTFVDNLEMQFDNVVVAVKAGSTRLFERFSRGVQGEPVAPETQPGDEAQSDAQAG